MEAMIKPHTHTMIRVGTGLDMDVDLNHKEVFIMDIGTIDNYNIILITIINPFIIIIIYISFNQKNVIIGIRTHLVL